MNNDNIFEYWIEKVRNGQKLYATFTDKTKEILEAHQLMRTESCAFCHGASSFLRSGHPMEKAEYIDCGHCNGKGYEMSYYVLDICNVDVLKALLCELKGREWVLKGCIN